MLQSSNLDSWWRMAWFIVGVLRWDKEHEMWAQHIGCGHDILCEIISSSTPTSRYKSICNEHIILTCDANKSPPPHRAISTHHMYRHKQLLTLTLDWIKYDVLSNVHIMILFISTPPLYLLCYIYRYFQRQQSKAPTIHRIASSLCREDWSRHKEARKDTKHRSTVQINPLERLQWLYVLLITMKNTT